MWIFSIFSSLLLLWLIALFIKRHQKDYTVITGLLLKILAGIVLGLIYKYHYHGGDTFQYFADSRVLFNYVLSKPGDLLAVLFNTINFPDLVERLVYADQPRALFFTKIITVFYFISGGNYWIISIILSFISFLCVHYLVMEILNIGTLSKRVVVLPFYFLPTFVFWTSGLLKESLAIGALMLLVALCLRMVRTNNFLNLKGWMAIAISSIILWELKYYYAAVAFPLLGTFLLYAWIDRRTRISVFLIPVFLLFGIFLVSFFHYNLNFTHLSDVIYQNYLLGIGHNLHKAIHYYHFDGSLAGYLFNAPLALFSGLFRPLPFESSGILPFLAGAENITILLLTLIGFWRAGFKLNIKDPVLMVGLIYIVSLAMLIAFSTPNFGTLSRYKVAYWPFFVLLVLILITKVRLRKT